MPDLSIIILNYKTSSFVLDSIRSIENHYRKNVNSGNFEMIVTDNASPDDSLKVFRDYAQKTQFKTFHVVDNGGNLGFGAGNNKGLPYAKGRYILFLNPDTIVEPNTLTYMIDFMDQHPEVGAASCKLINKNGNIDFNCHRGFPTPWNAFCYFSGLQRMFPKSKIFAGYTQGWKNMDTTHEVDVIEGAFMIIPREVGKAVGWFDEDYTFNGEDIQLCYDIKKLGKKIYYVGEMNIMHIGGVSGGYKKTAQNITTANIETRRRVQQWRFDAMRIFYKKNYAEKYPKILMWGVVKGIDYLQKKNMPRISKNGQNT